MGNDLALATSQPRKPLIYTLVLLVNCWVHVSIVGHAAYCTYKRKSHTVLRRGLRARRRSNFGPGGGSVRQREQFLSKKAADAFRIDIEGQLQAGTYRPDGSKQTVRTASESFLAHCEGRNERDERMTRKMLVVYRGHITNHIVHSEHGIGAWKLSQLTPSAVGKFRDRLRNAGVTVPTTRKVLATLHGVLEYAISQDWIATNAARNVKVIGPRGEGSKKIVPPSKDDLRALIDAAGDDLGLMLIFAASTGARAGEQWATRWRDVDLDKGELRITHRVDAYGEEGAPKSAAGIRCVPLSAQLIAALKAWKVQSKFSKAGDLVFANRAGRAHRARQSDQAAVPAVVRCGAGEAFQLARSSTLRSVYLDRSWPHAQDGADVLRSRVVASHDGSVRPSVSE